MVACAAKNNSRGKKMRTIDKDAASVPNNPIEEGIGMMQPHKGGTMSHGETLATPPLQKQMKMKEDPSEMTSADEAPMTKSTPWCIVQREEKKSAQKTGLTVALVVPMLQ